MSDVDSSHQHRHQSSAPLTSEHPVTGDEWEWDADAAERDAEDDLTEQGNGRDHTDLGAFVDQVCTNDILRY